MKLYTLYPLVFSLLACKKETTEKDYELPVVTISSPGNNDVFNAGATVTINGSIIDNNKVAEVHLHISNNSTGALLIDIHRYPNISSYTLNESFLTQAGINYKIQVIGKDNSANENRATVEITTN